MDWSNINNNNNNRNNPRSKKNSTSSNYGPFNYPIMSAAGGSSSSSSSNTLNINNNNLPLHQPNLPLNSPYNQQKPQFPKSLSPIISNLSTTSPSITPTPSIQIPIERTSYYYSSNPLFASDWVYLPNQQLDCIALGSYKEAFTNKLEIIHGLNYENEKLDQFNHMIDAQVSGNSGNGSDSTIQPYDEDDNMNGFYFQKVCETNLDYPITNVQWDPSMINYGIEKRLAASSEVLRLYKVVDEGNENYNLQQTHILANNTASNSTTSTMTNSNSNLIDDINTYPPVTSFDWNKTDPNILITSSVDTTCTVWDLHRSHPRDEMTDTATIKTQLIAHDSEVFDVKFIHNSTNIFASVGNDGSMRVFDLRSLEHSTIIYEPSQTTPTTNQTSPSVNSKALLTLTTSNIDQHHLATVGINSNQIIIIDMRMPGIPVAIIDGSLGGVNNAAINLIKYHPTSNFLVSGGDDCQSLVWDISNINNNKNNNQGGAIIDTPILAYEEDLEVNNVCWRQNQGDYIGVVSGKGFQAVSIYDI